MKTIHALFNVFSTGNGDQECAPNEHGGQRGRDAQRSVIFGRCAMFIIIMISVNSVAVCLLLFCVVLVFK
jgi:hypothetical protein